jgi:hypothetical protein
VEYLYTLLFVNYLKLIDMAQEGQNTQETKYIQTIRGFSLNKVYFVVLISVI